MRMIAGLDRPDSGTARWPRSPARPAQASEAIRGVSSTAREALAETRRLLGVQLVILRLIQEALTNTMKQAGPGANAAVRLRLEPSEVGVEVTDDGVGSAGVRNAPGGGTAAVSVCSALRPGRCPGTPLATSKGNLPSPIRVTSRGREQVTDVLGVQVH